MLGAPPDAASLHAGSETGVPLGGSDRLCPGEQLKVDRVNNYCSFEQS